MHPQWGFLFFYHIIAFISPLLPKKDVRPCAFITMCYITSYLSVIVLQDPLLTAQIDHSSPLLASSFSTFDQFDITDHLFLRHQQPKIFMIDIHPLILLYRTHEVNLYRSTWETSSNFPSECILSPSPTPLSPHLVWWSSTVSHTNWTFDTHSKAFNTGNLWPPRFLWDSSANQTQLRSLHNQPPQLFFRGYNCLYITS